MPVLLVAASWLTGCAAVLPAAPGAGDPAPGPVRELVPSPSSAADDRSADRAEPAQAHPMFVGTIDEIPDDVAARMVPTTWRDGCPVPMGDLRYLRMSYVDFDGVARVGEMIVHHDVAEDVVTVFRTIFAARFPIRQMRLMDDFGGDVHNGLAADNTYSFNCRRQLGNDQRWSEHAYGRAIDINPRENPYWHPAVGFVSPPSGADYVERSPATGLIEDDSVVVRAFADVGWKWGGDWTTVLDWMHFSPSGV